MIQTDHHGQQVVKVFMSQFLTFVIFEFKGFCYLELQVQHHHYKELRILTFLHLELVKDSCLITNVQSLFYLFFFLVIGLINLY